MLLFGLVGLYLRQAQHAGVLGLLGFVLTFLGVLFASIVAGFFFSSVLPYLAIKCSSAIQDGFSMVALFGLGGGVLLFLGTILLGTSIIRAGIFPRMAGIFILVGGLLSPAAVLCLNLVVSLIGSLSAILLVLGFAWIGSILYSLPEGIVTRAALLPSQAPDTLRNSHDRVDSRDAGALAGYRFASAGYFARDDTPHAVNRGSNALQPSMK